MFQENRPPLPGFDFCEADPSRRQLRVDELIAEVRNVEPEISSPVCASSIFIPVAMSLVSRRRKKPSLYTVTQCDCSI